VAGWYDDRQRDRRTGQTGQSRRQTGITHMKGHGMKQTIRKGAVAILWMILLTACAYTPSSHLTKKLFSDNVYVEVHVDKVEPENAPFVKDEMNRIVYNRFKGHIVNDKKLADSQIYVNYAGSTFYPLTYRDGYVTRYRVRVRVRFTMITPKGTLRKTISTVYDADIQESALTSSTLRIEAIKKGLEKALDEFLAYASAQSMVKEASGENDK
jgi:hypothetical protein